MLGRVGCAVAMEDEGGFFEPFVFAFVSMIFRGKEPRNMCGGEWTYVIDQGISQRKRRKDLLFYLY